MTGSGRRALFGMVVVAALVAGLVAGTVPASGQSGPEAPRHLTPEYLRSIDDARLHGTVTPPGAPLLEKQAELEAYDSLVQGYPTLTEAEITTKYFKDGRFREVTDIAREYRPRADVRVVRDARWGVPHIYGDTDAGAAFGAGYTAVEDRLPIILLLTALGRAEAFELLGDGAAWLADFELARLYGYTDEEFQSMIDRLPALYGRDGADFVALLDELVAGMNHALVDIAAGVLPLPATLADLGVRSPAPFRPTDVVAIVSIVRALFGAGGGGEMGNASRWLSLVNRYGADRARVLWDDFRNLYNRDSPVHTTGSFPYLGRDEAHFDPGAHVFGYASGATGVEAMLQQLQGLVGSLGTSTTALSRLDSQVAALAEQARVKTEHLVVDTPLGRIDLSRPGSMSNYFAVDGHLSSTGNPILLGGPQAAYFDPQILVENEIHGDRFHARGAGFPGMGLVVIGRNAEAAWTATAGGSDMIDTYVEKLCEPDGRAPTEASRHYMFKGQCREMDRRVIRRVTDAVPVDLPGRELLPDIIVERTVHGPVTARGVVGDTPVAISRKRSTYLKELDAGISILKLNRNEVPDAATFVEVFQQSHNLSTNWAYINAREIAYVHGGLYPVRPRTVDPDFPVWGTGEWEWETDAQGNDRFLSEHPHAIRPDHHYLVSWNNRPAHDWGASDGQWGFSSLYRSDLLEDQIKQHAPGTITPVRMVQIMEQAGLTDLRGSRVLPLALEILEAAPAPSRREAQMRDILRRWVRAGALRRDGDGDGNYDHGTAVAIMDAWWPGMIQSVYNPVLGSIGSVTRQGFHNAPGAAGSAFQGGLYGQVWTDLAMALGRPLRSPTSQVYCGSPRLGVSGNRRACAQRLWASLRAAGDVLGGDDPGAWNADAQSERIVFLPTAALTMHWVNRPTTQVLAMFGRRSEAPGTERAAGSAEEIPVGILPVTGARPVVPVPVALLVAALLAWLARRRWVRLPA